MAHNAKPVLFVAVSGVARARIDIASFYKRQLIAY